MAFLYAELFRHILKLEQKCSTYRNVESLLNDNDLRPVVNEIIHNNYMWWQFFLSHIISEKYIELRTPAILL